MRATPGEKVTLLLSDTSFTSGNFVDYYLPVGVRNDPYKLLCVEGPKFTISGGTRTATGGKIYFPIKNAGYGWRLRDCQGICLPPGETSYSDLSSCMFSYSERYYSSRNNTFYATETECVTAETGTFGVALSSGGCYFAPPSSGVQTSLLQNAGLVAISDETKCSCATKPDSFGIMTDIFVANPDGTIKRTYFTGSSRGSTALAFNDAKLRCFTQNTERFYNPTTRQCFGTLESCKAAATASALLECTEAKEGNMFLLLPPSKTEITPAEETAKRTGILNCVRGGKTNEQCIKDAFGSSITSDNFYRCRCEADLSVLCLTTGVCSKICKLNKVGFTNVVVGETVKIFSPLQFIKVLSNFLFYAAIFLFIINFLLAGFDYVRSGGQPDALKTAKAKITSAVGGLVFILLVGALLNYVISILIGAGFQA